MALTAVRVRFRRPLGDAEGGCINNSSVFASAFLSVNDSSVIDNIAQAGNGSAGSIDATPGFFGVVNLAVGGGIMNFSYLFLPAPRPVVTSVASITNTVLTGNEAIGGDNSKGGNASRNIVDDAGGGGIWNDATCSLILNDSRLSGNEAIGGSGGTGGTGVVQQVGVGEGTALATSALTSSTATRSAITLLKEAVGARPAPATPYNNKSTSARVAASPASLGLAMAPSSRAALWHNIARGGIGADGLGGGLFNDKGDTATFIASSFTLNQAIAGEGGEGIGGGVYSLGTIVNRVGILTNKHKPNHATTSNNDIFPSGNSNILS